MFIVVLFQVHRHHLQNEVTASSFFITTLLTLLLLPNLFQYACDIVKIAAIADNMSLQIFVLHITIRRMNCISHRETPRRAVSEVSRRFCWKVV